MNVARQISRRFGRATVARTRSAASDCVVRAVSFGPVSFGPDPLEPGDKKVAPAEIDEQILKIPGVVDCACVGVPDPNGVLGEVVKGCIVRAEGSELTFADIANRLVGNLETYKMPVVWQWIEAVPKTHNGKIQRGLLK